MSRASRSRVCDLTSVSHRGSIYSPEPSLALSFHAYTKPTETDPSLFDANAPLLKGVTIPAQRFYQYNGDNGMSSFWRFLIEVPLQNVEMTVRYRLNGGAEMTFVIPAVGQNFRWAAHSCNGEFDAAYDSCVPR